MGFKIATSKTGNKYCCLEAVLPTYSDIPQDITILFSMYERDRKTPNKYMKRDIQKLGRCIGIKELAEWEWNDNEIKLPLQGRKLRIDIDDENNWRRVAFAPMRDYPVFGANADDDIPFDDAQSPKAVMSNVMTDEERKEEFKDNGGEVPF